MLSMKTTKVMTATDKEESLQLLNEALAEGWRIIGMCPMPSSLDGAGNAKEIRPTCLVVLEKET